MLKTLRRADLVGITVVDRNGAALGKVRDTFPQDGGGVPDMVLVDVGKFMPRRRWLPVQQSWLVSDELNVPFARWQVEDGPSAEDNRWGDPAAVARAYWFTVDD